MPISSQAAESDALQEHALQEIDAQLVKIQPLAVESGNAAVIQGVQHLRDLVTSELSQLVAAKTAKRTKDVPTDLSPRQQRNARFKAWATERRLHGFNTFNLQGALLKSCLSQTIQRFQLAFARARLESVDARDAGYRTLKICVSNFDPGIHGDRFMDFVEPIVDQLAAQCIEQRTLVVPELVGQESGLYVQTLINGPKNDAAPVQMPVEIEKADAHHIVDGSLQQSDPRHEETVESPVADEPLSPEAQAEFMRQARVQEYVRDHLPNAAHVYDQASAENALNEAYQNVARTMLHGELKRHHHINKPKNAPLEKAAKEILTNAIATFNPEESDGDRFRGHLQKIIAEDGKRLYDSHC